MFAFLFKRKATEPERDEDFELAKLALADRLDAMLAQDTRRKLRFATLNTPKIRFEKAKASV
jgi:hypothetical protein